MYLLYVDESGRARGAWPTHIIVAGLALHEDDCYPFAKSLERLQRKWVGASKLGLELHASDMWSGRREWAQVKEGVRRGLIAEIFRHIATWRSTARRRPLLFAVVVHKPSFPARAMERAHEEIFARFDEFLTRQHRQGESHRSIVIADDSSYESLLQTLVPRWKAGGRLGPLHSFVEVPLYVDSRASRLVQAADFVAWGTYHYYETGITRFLQRISSRFDAEGGIQHGLAHLRRGYRTCPCAPCESRRTHNIARRLPPAPAP